MGFDDIPERRKPKSPLELQRDRLVLQLNILAKSLRGNLTEGNIALAIEKMNQITLELEKIKNSITTESQK